MAQKHRSICKALKPVEDFHIDANKAHGRRCECKSCGKQSKQRKLQNFQQEAGVALNSRVGCAEEAQVRADHQSAGDAAAGVHPYPHAAQQARLAHEGEEQKHCSICKTLKPVEEFYKDASRGDKAHGCRPECKSCGKQKKQKLQLEEAQVREAERQRDEDSESHDAAMAYVTAHGTERGQAELAITLSTRDLQVLLNHKNAELAEKDKLVQQLTKDRQEGIRTCQRLRAENDRLRSQLARRDAERLAEVMTQSAAGPGMAAGAAAAAAAGAAAGVAARRQPLDEQTGNTLHGQEMLCDHGARPILDNPTCASHNLTPRAQDPMQTSTDLHSNAPTTGGPRHLHDCPWDGSIAKSATL